MQIQHYIYRKIKNFICKSNAYAHIMSTIKIDATSLLSANKTWSLSGFAGVEICYARMFMYCVEAYQDLT